MKYRRAALLWLVCGLAAAQDEAAVNICYNYDCVQRAEVRFTAADLRAPLAGLAAATDAAGERAALADALGGLYRIAGQQTPIRADRAGNFLDGGVEGRMDCIDHSTSTTALLRMLEGRGGLRFHRVMEPVRRTRLGFVLQHFSAAIEEIEPVMLLAEPVIVPDHVALLLAACDCAEVLDDIPRPPAPPPGNPGARFAVDSWFVEHGEPAVVLPLRDWLNGEGPNVQ